MKLNNLKSRSNIYLLLLLILTGLIYSKTIKYGFYFDDKLIFENPFLGSFSNVGNAIKQYAFRPLGVIIWLLISFIWGVNPTFFHLFSIAFHLISGLTLYWMITTVLNYTNSTDKSDNYKISLSVTAFFLLHPLQTQVVVYPVQAIAIIPMAISIFLAVISYVKYRYERKKYYLIFIFLLCITASTSKENGILLPAILILLEYIFISEFDLKKLIKQLPVLLSFSILSLSVFLICSSFMSYEEMGIGLEIDGISPKNYLTTQFVVIMRYLFLTIMPIGQNLDYDFKIYNSFFSLKPFLSFLILVFLAGTGFYLRRYKFYCFGVISFFLFLAPTSSIVPITDVIFEHRMYLPLVGIFLSIAVFVLNSSYYKKEKGKIYSIFTVIFIIMTILTNSRLDIWKDNYTLWNDVIKKSPGKARSYFSLGTILSKEKRVQEAIPFYKKALSLDPGKIGAYINLGNIYLDNGDLNAAVKYLSTSVKLNKKNDKAHYNLAVAYERLGDHDNALIHYKMAISTNKHSYASYMGIANTLAYKKRYSEAEFHYKEAIKIKPNFAIAYSNLGTIYVNQSKIDLAIRSYKKALSLNPNLTLTQNNLERVLKETTGKK